MRENVVVFPPTEIETRARRQKFEARLRHVHASFTRQHRIQPFAVVFASARQIPKPATDRDDPRRASCEGLSHGRFASARLPEPHHTFKPLTQFSGGILKKGSEVHCPWLMVHSRVFLFKRSGYQLPTMNYQL